jgi:hypothetical protein
MYPTLRLLAAIGFLFDHIIFFILLLIFAVLFFHQDKVDFLTEQYIKECRLLGCYAVWLL